MPSLCDAFSAVPSPLSSFSSTASCSSASTATVAVITGMSRYEPSGMSTEEPSLELSTESVTFAASTPASFAMAFFTSRSVSLPGMSGVVNVIVTVSTTSSGAEVGAEVGAIDGDEEGVSTMLGSLMMGTPSLCDAFFAVPIPLSRFFSTAS
jgi:hypothetical protein